MCMKKGGVRAFEILGQCIRAPFKALGRACEFYVKSMTGCAGRMPHGPVFGMAGGVFSEMPYGDGRGFYRSAADDEEDYYRELLWAASQVGPGPGPARPGGDSGAGARCRSVAAMERIDEDEACEFAADGADLGSGPRNWSSAIVAQEKVGVSG